jgi:hypothetical protein
MWIRPGVMLLGFLALQSILPTKTSDTLRQRYGSPMSETFQVRPELAASVTYGPSGSVCEIIISPHDPMFFMEMASTTIDSTLLQQVIDELAPVSERGEAKTGGIVNGVCGSNVKNYENYCGGTFNDWENLDIFKNPHWAMIRWHRDECIRKLNGVKH